MKIPKARQLPSGAWFCRVRIDGQDVSITRPTEKEAIAEAMAVKAGIKEAEKRPRKKTLSQAIDDYIEARRNILSPATIRGYRIIQNSRFQNMMHRDVFTVTQEQWQRAVNLEARRLSAKTITNSWRFLSAVITEVTGKHYTIHLPQVIPASRPWLAPEQIPVFVKALKGKKVEIAALLALSSLRCSEILDLTWDDIDLERKQIQIDGSAVFDENDVLVHKKENKNASSRRIVPMIPPLVEALQAAPRKSSYIVTMSSNWMYKSINQVCEEAGLPKVGIHGLRHSFASLAYHLGMPEKVAMEIGGWADDRTMHKIYTHISDQSVTTAANAFSAFFSP